MKLIKNIGLALALLASMALCYPAAGQTTAALLDTAAANSTALSQAVTGQVPVILGTPITIKGQTFLVSTNAAGQIQVYSYGAAGTNGMVVPSNPQQAMEVATAWIQANNPANAGYYGTNELDVRVGAAYVQNSGQAVALIAVEKYGLFGWSQIGIGAGVLQGNNNGQSGTAGFYGSVCYRKPIGDVAVNGGVIFGYDNWNHVAFGGGKIGLEYRQNAHLGEFLDYDYAFEPGQGQKGGSLISAGIEYSF